MEEKISFKVYPVQRWVVEESHTTIEEDGKESVVQSFIYCECHTEQDAQREVKKRTEDIERLI